MKLLDIVVKKAIIPTLSATDRDGAVSEIIDALVSAKALSPKLRDEFVKAIIKRENRGSTGFGHGVAVPHVKHAAISKMAVAVGISQAGVEFNALDRQPVYSIFLLLSPEDNPEDHLDAMEVIFGNLSQETFRRFLRQATTVEDVLTLLENQGDAIALVMLAGVNFYTGQVFDMSRIAAAGRHHGCAVGLQLAHAAGNVQLHLHDWEVDFAVWCSYKYLNAGPGAVAGCFVHQRHGRNLDLPRFAGWWGDDPESRFLMHLQRDFVPQPGAAGWQVSNPPILSMAPLKASLEMFDEAGMDALRHKSRQLTGYLRFLLQRSSNDRFEIITPSDPDAQGCQLSILVRDQPKQRHEAVLAEGAVCDFREPNIIRAAPVPLYNTFHEVWRFAQILTANL